MILVKNGVEKKVSTGFSWKSLFFGIFYPLCKGDLKGAGIQTLLSFFSFGVSLFIVPFTYNKSYMKRLKLDGFVEKDINV